MLSQELLLAKIQGLIFISEEQRKSLQQLAKESTGAEDLQKIEELIAEDSKILASALTFQAKEDKKCLNTLLKGLSELKKKDDAHQANSILLHS